MKTLNKRWIVILLLVLLPCALHLIVREQLSWKPRRFQAGGSIAGMAFSPDGKLLALGRYEQAMLKKTPNEETWEIRGRLEVWDISWQRPAMLFSVAEADPVVNPRFAPINDAIFYISRAQRLCRLDLATRRTTVLWKLDIRDTQQFDLTPNGRVVTTRGEQIRLHNASSGQLLRTLRKSPQAAPEKTMAAEKMEDMRFQSTGAPSSTAGYSVPEDTLDWVQCSRDGKIACVRVGYDSSFEIWNLETGQKIGRAGSDSGSVEVGRLSPDGKTLAYGIQSTVKLFDIESRRTRTSLQTGSQVLQEIEWSNDNTQIAVGNGTGELMLFDAKSGKQLRHFGGLKHYPLDTIAFSPDDRILASAKTYPDTITLQRIR
jgi:WD40 repeat protein